MKSKLNWGLVVALAFCALFWVAFITICRLVYGWAINLGILP